MPALFAAAGMVLAWWLTDLDRRALVTHPWLASLLPDLDPEAVRVILGTIAGSTITVLSLVYSMTLVVFTLAAGTLGPRLVERFLEDQNSQIAAGVLAATFSFALVAMVEPRNAGAARLSVMAALVLALASLATLLLFVRAISRRVTLDSELARIADSLAAEAAVLARARNEEAARAPHAPAAWPPPGLPLTSVAASASGYASRCDVGALIELARQQDAQLELLVQPGDPVLQGAPVARFHGGGAETEARIRALVGVAGQRAEADDASFNLHLLLEIALRALSPGINDSYTALAVTDRLVAAMLVLLRAPPATAWRGDEDGVARVLWPDFDGSAAIGAIFPVLRRAAHGNALVVGRLADVLAMLAGLVHPGHRAALLAQAHALRASVDAASFEPTDRAMLEARCAAAERSLAGAG